MSSVDRLFQFTPLREGRPEGKLAELMEDDYFNSRPCVRGDFVSLHAAMRFAVFQFTPLREGRQGVGDKAGVRGDFNSRPCVRGDVRSRASSGWRSIFQFTPLREGRQIRRI